MKPMPKKNGEEGWVFIHLGQADYFKQMTRSKFTLSPPGFCEKFCGILWKIVCEKLLIIPIRKWRGLPPHMGGRSSRLHSYCEALWNWESLPGFPHLNPRYCWFKLTLIHIRYKNKCHISDEWDTTYKTQEKFLDFSPPNLSKKHAMAQYWFDRINTWRDK